MKKLAAWLCILSILMMSAASYAASNSWTCSNCGFSGNPLGEISCRSCGAYKNSSSSTGGSSTAFNGAWVETSDKISSRTGPGTHYDSAGTYGSAGTQVIAYSIWVDSGNVTWVECEIANRRIYTGLKRFKNPDRVRAAVPYLRSLGISARLTQSCNAYFGPGYGYDMQSVGLSSGKYVTIVSMENGWAQVEWSDHRGWMPCSALSY